MYITDGQLPNNWAKLFCSWRGKGTCMKAAANSNVYSTCVPFNSKRHSSLSSVKFSCLISYYLHSVP